MGHGQAVATELPVETAAAGPLLWRCRCGAAAVGLQWDCCGTAVRVAVGHVQAVATELAERSPAILGFLRASAVELVPGGCCRKAAAGRLLLGGCCWEAAAGRLLLGGCCWEAAAGKPLLGDCRSRAICVNFRCFFVELTFFRVF